MKATILLCDACQQVNGKLYILGAGWTQAMIPPGTAIPISIGLVVSVDWNEANRPFSLKVILLTQDGTPVGPDGAPIPDDEALRIGMEGDVEVGRPPGSVSGIPLQTTFALNFGNVPLQPGLYSWVVEINGSEMAREPFSIKNI